jgi:CRP-like cAMP-binding protein
MPPLKDFLSDASPRLRDLLRRSSTLVELSDGQILFSQGDNGDALYGVRSGQIELSVLSSAGRKLTLDVLRSGTVFGEIALFDPGTRTATATAIGPTRVLRVRSRDLMPHIEASPALALDLVQVAGQRMRWMNRQLREHVFLPMPDRLALRLLHLTEHGREGRRQVDMSQSDLAEFVGATREAVSKTLSGWKAKGLIEVGRGTVEILDPDALRGIVGAEEFE